MKRYQGKAALVTGAASGIGEAVSRRLVSAGMTVYACDSDSDGLNRVKDDVGDDEQGAAANKPSADESTGEGCFVPMVCDLRNEDDISKMFEAIKEESGYASVCVLSAGVGHKAPLLEGESSMFRNMFEINVLSSVLCAQKCVKLMRESKVDDGHLVLINSLAGHSVRIGKPDYADFNFYNATKHALTAITEGIRFELRLAQSKIRVSQISPGLVQTKFTHSMYPDEGHIVDLLYQCTVTLQPDDVADAVIHTLSQPRHVQIHDIHIRAKGPDRPADWEKKVKKVKKAASKPSDP